MATILAIAVGGGIGSVARYLLTLWCERLLGEDFPYGVFLANIIGSFAIGICFVFLLERAVLPELARSLLMVGFLGGFTTFSAFSLQTINMLQSGRWPEAMIYVFGSVLLSLFGAWAGMFLARELC
ncbi:MAG: fluoride efflux transporter CrcB [Pseudohongiellaceae bacterium]